MWHYESAADGVEDALRLARAMTYKAAAAGLDLGGGKGVICAPTRERPEGELRRRMLLDFGDAVESLAGRYVTAEDVGTGAADMVTIAERTAHVVGLPAERGGRGDPSPLTARGVLGGDPRLPRASLRRCLAVRCPGLRGRRRQRRRPAGANAGRRRRGAHDLRHRPRAQGRSPRSSGRHGSIRRRRSRPIATSSPPALSAGRSTRPRFRGFAARSSAGPRTTCSPTSAWRAPSRQRGILLAPDFIANAGGLINVYAELRDLDDEVVLRLVDGIGPTMRRILEVADRKGITPLAAAQEQALERLQATTAAAA